MATLPPRTERRRARPGSLQRPVNGRLYRGTWLLVGLPLLVTAFSVARPTPLPRAFLPAFDGEAAKQLANDLVTSRDPNRSPGRLDAWGLGEPPAPEPHDPLPLDRRRSLRRIGRRVVREAFTPTARRRRGHQPRRRRWQRPGPPAVQRRHASNTFRDVPGNRRGTRRGPDRPSARSRKRAESTRRPRLSLLALRAGAVSRKRDRRGDDHDCRGQAPGSAERHGGPATRGPLRPGGPRGTGCARDARRGTRVRTGDVELRVPRDRKST